MPYKVAMNSLGGFRRRQQSDPTTTTTTNPPSGFYGSTAIHSTMSPMVFRAPKDYDIAIADNPVRYAVINAPFLKLRKRTESLLDQITGGTLPAQVLEQERKQKDMERQLKCRGCKVVFGSEEGLNGHLRLFPAHVNPPEYKRKARRSKKGRPRRSHSTSDVASSAASITSSSRRSGRPSRHGRSNTIALPITTPGSHLHTLQQAPATAPRTFEEAVELVKERNDLVRPSAPRALPDVPMVQPEWPEPNSFDINAPRLPAMDFGSFQDISTSGAREVPLARPIPIKEDKPKPLIDYEERNVKAGAYATLRSIAQREEEQRRKNKPQESPSLPTSFSGMVKAVLATGQSERAVLPTPPGAYITALHDITNLERGPTPPPKSAMRSNRKLTIRNLSPNDDVVEESKRRAPLVDKTMEPVITGMTSFSSQEDIPETPTNPRRFLQRRSTNPFLNESFMNSLPSTKTPPLSPSTPFTSRSSPGNPFIKMMESYREDNVDDFYDAPDTPPLESAPPVFLRKRTNTNPFFPAVEEEEVNHHEQHQQQNHHKEMTSSSSRRIPRSASFNVISSTQQSVYSSSPSRGVHFEHKAAMKADDNPRCPSCRRAFIDLTSVLIHLERSNCNQAELNEGQITEAF